MYYLEVEALHDPIIPLISKMMESTRMETISKMMMAMSLTTSQNPSLRLNRNKTSSKYLIILSTKIKISEYRNLISQIKCNSNSSKVWQINTNRLLALFLKNINRKIHNCSISRLCKQPKTCLTIPPTH